MNGTAYAALGAWIPISLAMFALVRPSRAVLLTLMLGHLFLPQATIDLPGIVDLSKPNVASIGALLGILLFDPGSFRHLRLKWLDLLALTWMLCPLPSALDNGLGVFDGLSGVARNALEFGVPYLAGRLYLRSAGQLRDALLIIVIGGVLYVPLCLYEIRMSPTLHSTLYGFHQHQFAQSIRFGGWRPTVFMQHGLAVGMWMAAAAVAALGLRLGGMLPRVAGMGSGLLCLVLAATLIGCKSTGSVVLGLAGAVVVWRYWRSGRRRWLVVLVAVAPTYLAARVATDAQPELLMMGLEEVSPSRADSLRVRLEAEAQVRDRAFKRPLFGWGGWGRFRQGLVVDATDSLWSITLGQRGLLGLLALFGLLILPQWRTLRAYRAAGTATASGMLAGTAIVVLAIYTLDCMVNALVNPMFILLAGGLVALESESRSPGEGRLT